MFTESRSHDQLLRGAYLGPRLRKECFPQVTVLYLGIRPQVSLLEVNAPIPSLLLRLINVQMFV